nr:hypothetical protein [Tanacetum cinerariifolium]
MTKAITDFGVGTIIIYPDIDPLLEETKEKEKSNDDWDCLLDFNIDDVPLLGEEGLLPFTMGTHDNEAVSSRSKRSRQHETVEEVLLPQLHHEFLLWERCKRDAKSRMGCDGEIDDMLRIRLCDAGSD